MGSSGPILSIITISRNSEATIERTLRSVADQEGIDPGAIEHWLIDGASKDQTLAIASRFPHVQVRSEADRGISDAFNKGIRAAKGQWILFLNSDDELADNRVLQDLLPKLDAKYDFVYGQISVVDPATNELLRSGGKDCAWRFLHQRMTIPHPATFMNRSYVEKFGSFDEKFQIAMDYELLLRGYSQAKFRFVPRVVNRFALGGASTANRALKQAYECYLAKRKNGTGNEASRLFWLLYQGARMSLEPVFTRLPGVGSAMKWLASTVDRGY